MAELRLIEERNSPIKAGPRATRRQKYRQEESYPRMKHESAERETEGGAIGIPRVIKQDGDRPLHPNVLVAGKLRKQFRQSGGATEANGGERYSRSLNCRDGALRR
jgi:hypothetical protein